MEAMKVGAFEVARARWWFEHCRRTCCAAAGIGAQSWRWVVVLPGLSMHT